MSEKFESDFSGDEFESAYRALEEREFDLRVKMFALDMAVQALPTLAIGVSNLDEKLSTLHRAAAEFEKILRGEN